MGVIRANDPWGLTERQHEVCEALVRHGTTKGVAREFDLSVRTVEAHLWAIGKRMEIKRRLLIAIAYDRWSRGEGAV